MMDMRVGFIGLGEAGYFMSKGLGREGVSGIKAFDVALDLGGSYKDTVLERAKDAGVTLVSSIQELAGACTVIFCAVQAQYAAEVADKALPFMPAGAVFVDLTTARPDQKRASAQTYAKAGFSYIDGAMMGSLPLDGHKVSTLCSGMGAKELCERMNAFGMRMQFVEGDAGMATTHKLVRSSFTKGAESLAVETMLFARKMGIEKEVLQSLAANYAKTTFDETIVRLVRSDMIHAERRAHEVEESAALMERCGIVPVMARATIERMRRTAELGLKEELKGVTPKTVDEVYTLWEAKKYS